jgi:methylphosphotriester-DNA--protein-cysteine methyltransferase
VTDDERWQALVDRDPEADGAFIYCVTSTKVYCRPTCSARLALRSNIVYFDTMKEAVAAGYRPCRRCNPDVSEMNSQRRAVGSVCNLIHSLEPDKVPRVKKLAESVGLTLWHFHRLFKRYTGLTPRQYITEFHKRKRLGLPQLQVSKVVTKKSYERQQRRQGSNGSTPQQSPQVGASSPAGEVEAIKLETPVETVQPLYYDSNGVTHNAANVGAHSSNVTHNTSHVGSNATSATSSIATPLSNTTSPDTSTPAQDSAYIIAHGSNASNAAPVVAPGPATGSGDNWIKTEPSMDFMPRYEPRYDQSISIDAPMFIPDGNEYHHNGEMLGDMWGTL